MKFLYVRIKVLKLRMKLRKRFKKANKCLVFSRAARHFPGREFEPWGRLK